MCPERLVVYFLIGAPTEMDRRFRQKEEEKVKRTLTNIENSKYNLIKTLKKPERGLQELPNNFLNNFSLRTIDLFTQKFSSQKNHNFRRESKSHPISRQKSSHNRQCDT